MKRARTLMKRAPKLAALAVCVATVLALAACGSSSAGGAGGVSTVKEGTLTVLSDLAYPPLESVPEGKTAADCEGYEVDVVDAVAGKLGLEAEWSQVKFDTIIPQIKQGGRADIGASAFTVNDERAEEIDFTDPYLDSNQGLVMAASSKVLDPDTELNNAYAKVAVQSGTTGEAWVEENLTNAQVVPLDDVVQCLMGVQTGSYDACVADLPVLSYLCNTSYKDLAVKQEIATGEQYGFVVSKDNPGLTKAIDKAYKELVDDGTIAKLQEKWFGEQL